MRSAFTALLFAACAALVAPQRALPHPVRHLQLLRGDVARSKEPPLNAAWFSEDAQRMSQMPPSHAPDSEAKAALLGDSVCNPQCFYSCGRSECDQACEPLCLPPKCETLCAKSEDKCNTRCGKPKCAVICPTGSCVGSNCPKCRTLCSPPVCTTSCSGSCHSVCSQPQCSWKCKAGSCPKPDCKMTCSGAGKACQEKFAQGASRSKVPLMPGMDMKAEGVASLDPTVLTQPSEAPASEGAKVSPADHSEAPVSPQSVPVSSTGGAASVRFLKQKWAAEDQQGIK